MASSNPIETPPATTFGATIVPRPSEKDAKTTTTTTTALPSSTSTTTAKGLGLQVLETPNLTPQPSHEDLTSPSQHQQPEPAFTSTLSHPAYSPFYEHDRNPLDRAGSSYTHYYQQQHHNNPNEKDLEAGIPSPNGVNGPGARTTTPLLSIPHDPPSPFSTRISLQRTAGTTNTTTSNSRPSVPYRASTSDPTKEKMGSVVMIVDSNTNDEDSMWPTKQTLLRGRQAEKKRRRDRKLVCARCTGPVVEFWGGLSKGKKLLIKICIAVLVLGLAVTIGLCISIAVHGGVYDGKGREENINTRR